MTSFEKYQLLQVLSNTQDGAALLVEDSTKEKAIFLPSKTNFSQQDFDRIFSSDTTFKQVQENDKYAKYEVFPQNSKYDMNIIFKATEKEIAKFSSSNWHYIRETPLIYKQVTLPFIKEQVEPKWIQNMISGNHTEEVFHEDDSFLLSPNITWERSKLCEAYCLAIVKYDIKSLRDVREYKFLEEIKEITHKIFAKEFGIQSDQIISYFHYLPSFWHLHIHFSSSKATVLGSNRSVGKAILLDDVIQNVKMDSNYYEKCDLTIQCQETSTLWDKYQKHRNETQ